MPGKLERLSRLERTGALRLLVILRDGPMFISELIRRHDNQGIASQPALEKTRAALTELELIEEYEQVMELTKKTRLYLRLTEKGKSVADVINRACELLADS
jgi:DNA-binding HxlR family transcriptional regulator